MSEYTQEIIHQFDLTKGVPLDVRFYLDSFSTFDTKIPKTKRYPGLIVWVNDRKMFYICTDKVSAPKSIVEFLSSSNVSSVSLNNNPIPVKARNARIRTTSIYDKLNATVPKAGNIVTVEPLKVSFIYDGENWRYLTGIYNFPSIYDYKIFPNELKVIGNKVVIDNNDYLITNDYSLTQKVTVIEKSIKNDFHYLNDCYYDIDGVLHYYFGNKLYKLGEKILVKENFQINSNTKITHNLKSPLISAIFRINSLNSEVDNIIITPELKFITEDEIEIQSKTDVKGNLILITNI